VAESCQCEENDTHNTVYFFFWRGGRRLNEGGDFLILCFLMHGIILN